MKPAVGTMCQRDEPVRVWIIHAADWESRQVAEDRGNRHAGFGVKPADDGLRAPIEIWGLSPVERLRRSLFAAGVPRANITLGDSPPAVGPGVTLLIFRADYIFDERVVHALVRKPAEPGDRRGLVLIDPQTPSAGVAVRVQAEKLEAVFARMSAASPASAAEHVEPPLDLRPDDLVAAYSSALRKHEVAYVLPVRREALTQIENHIFQAAYKGVTDLITKWVWPRPARGVTRLLAHHHVSPNAVTGLSWLLVGITTWFFIHGQYGAGLGCAWLMTFFDTVDGKLARVTCTSSRIGHVLDHGLDLVHPPFWYLAWAVGLAGSFSLDLLWTDLATVLIVGGYILGRLLEGLFLLVFGLEMHSWRPIDSWFRMITARRNPNLVLLSLGALVGRPELGFWSVAVWTVASLMFHTLRFGQACAFHMRGRSVQTWQAAETSV